MNFSSANELSIDAYTRTQESKVIDSIKEQEKENGESNSVFHRIIMGFVDKCRFPLGWFSF